MSVPSKRPELDVREAAGMIFRALEIGLKEPLFRTQLFWGFIFNGLAFCAFVVVLLWAAFGWVDGLVSASEQPDPDWLLSAWYWIRDGLGFVLKTVTVFGVLLMSPVVFNLLAAVVLPALHGHIFRIARSYAGGDEVDGGGRHLLAEMASVIKRLLRFLCLSICLLPLLLLPGGSVVYLLGQFYLTSRALAWEILSHHLELHGWNDPQQRRFMREHSRMATAVGAAAALLAMIPGVQMLAITTNVIGAGMLSARLDG